jgi:hypothetical protein
MTLTYTCEICRGTFISNPRMTDEDRKTEYERTHGKPFSSDDEVGSVCDECYPEVIEWCRSEGLLP